MAEATADTLAISAPASSRQAGAWRYLPALAAAAATLWFARFLAPVAHGAIPEYVVPWVPELGVAFAFRLDGLALAFALLICGIGALVFLYTATYFRGDRRLLSLLLTLVAFAISMLGLTTADDAITLFVFWEGTTVTSWLLIGFDHERADARAAALQALLVTGLGGMALLGGLLIMGGVAGTYRLSEMNLARDVVQASALYPAIFALVILGCFAKSAQWPFQFWLPNAMAAPTPVSAYLHSATMVKAGVYLMARLSPALGGTDAWFWTLVPVGGFTMLLASVWALRQTDLKLMLAFTTIMALSMITMLLGLGTPLAVTAAMTFLLVHAFYKAGLFLAVGMLERGSGSREYDQVAGLGRAMPLTAGIVALAALSMAGVAPLFGFLGKELIYEGTTEAGSATVAAAFLANALMVTCAAMVALRPFFFRPPRSPRAQPADPGWGLWLGPAILAALGLFCGVYPGWIEHELVAPMVMAVAGVDLPIHLALWHGVTAALILSLVTLVLGWLIYLFLDRIQDFLAGREPGLPETEAWYDAGVEGTAELSRRASVLIQDGNMTTYLRRTFLALGALIWVALILGSASWPALALSPELIDWAIVLLVAAAIVMVLRTDSPLTAITALGGVGAGIAVIFVVYGAPDVAMTQLFVEILVVVFLAIAMVRLPRTGVLRFSLRNALVAGFLGVGVTLSLLMVLGTELDRSLTTYFEARSAPEALGRNIVNVILVDFRGLDTLGETAVIAFAAIAAFAVLKAGRKVRG